MSSEIIKNICDYRLDLINLLLKKKIHPSIFGHKTYLYLRQNKIKYIKKASSQEDYIINYFYFLSKIERKLAYERDLIPYELNCKNFLIKKTMHPIEQRDKMIKKLFISYDGLLDVESVILVREDIIQINTKTYPEFAIYITKNTMKYLLQLNLKSFEGIKVKKNLESRSILVNFIDIDSMS